MKKIYNIITTTLLILLIALVLALFAPKIMGLTPMAVLSGSMEPVYHVGSLIYVDKMEPDEVRVGDPITFSLSGDTVVTHRVTAVNKEAQSFRTKGDANDTEDGSAVAYDSLIGKPVFTVPLLGYLAVYANTKPGFIILVTLIIVVLILTFLPDLLMKEKENEGKEELEKEKF